MVLGLLLALSLADWVPARWPWGDAKSLELLDGTPFNCLLLEQDAWSEGLLRAAAARGVVTLGVVRGDLVESARRAATAGLGGVAIEGDFDARPAGVAVEIRMRGGLRLDGGADVLATGQGVWPGVHVQKDGAVKAAPTGAAWIDTNAGFLRFVRANTSAPLWVANLPPPQTVIPLQRYLQAISDAGAAGARWVVSVDADFGRRLAARQAAALGDWKRMAAYAQFFEDHREWRGYRLHGELALVEDIGNGALLAGGIVDMIVARHTPVRPVRASTLSDGALAGAKLAVNVDPASLPAEKKEVLARFARSGGTILTAPPGSKLPAPRPGQITLDAGDVDKLDAIWRDVNALTGRRNLGVRLFNVASMLSTLLASPDGRRLALHLVNYSAYPAENITVHLVGAWRRARLLAPESAPRDLATYPIEEGTGIEVPRVATLATVEIE